MECFKNSNFSTLLLLMLIFISLILIGCQKNRSPEENVRRITEIDEVYPYVKKYGSDYEKDQYFESGTIITRLTWKIEGIRIHYNPFYQVIRVDQFEPDSGYSYHHLSNSI